MGINVPVPSPVLSDQYKNFKYSNIFLRALYNELINTHSSPWRYYYYLYQIKKEVRQPEI